MIVIVDCGMGNLRSVHKAFERVGHPATITQDPEEICAANAVVLPGQGAFRDCIGHLGEHKLVEPVIEFIRSGRPYLGICLGLQLLFTESEEFGCHKGMNVVPGRVRRFPAGMTDGRGSALKVPHMGWNQAVFTQRPPIFDGIPDGAFFYFAHSYFVDPLSPGLVATTTDYGVRFVSGIWYEQVFGVQFHPEKSQAYGLRLLKNFGDLAL
ncbi:MAG: imidazole glycerol phosphate synthase subunit HisH [Nitrospinae bacterium]|nr:imidazole glycerol phosphate synthase subunit HisH [Nitrospinota bacterium]